MANRPPERIFQGRPVSGGIVIAPIHITARGLNAPEVYAISDNQVAWEKERFKTAINRTKTQLEGLQENLTQISGASNENIFEAHTMVLADKSLQKKVHTAIEERLQNAEYCFYAVIQTFAESLRRVSDSYLAERASDFDDICQRVLQNFQANQEPEEEAPDVQHLLVAYELSPSDTASLDRNKTLGFATEQGSEISHTAILARSLSIPAVSGIKDAIMSLTSLNLCILDGYKGQLIANPSEETLERYRELKRRKEAERVALDELRDQSTATTDGRQVTLSANMEFEDELPLIESSGAEGIGLFRTEFFLLEGRNHNIPDEDEQEILYSKAVKASAPHSVIIRTLDAGGDKLPGEPLKEPDPNPFLGWRGIRYSLDRPESFKDQLRAILRASAHGKTGVMFPLVSGVREVRAAKGLLHECMDELSNKDIAFDKDIEVGVMIEVPSAALMAGEIAEHVDFFSIGTNDLVQYSVAVDRVNPRVSALYKTSHPSVLRLMKMTVEGAQSGGIWTGVCGEMAGRLDLLPILVGIGIDKLSVVSPFVPAVKKAICSLNFNDCQELANEALKLPQSDMILNLSTEMAKSAYPELLY